MKNRVLVLMSTYNGGKYLREQINSVFSQEGCDVDLLIRDDGSTDETLMILKEFSESNSLSYYCGNNMQSAKSFMHLLINCDKTYDYYAFCDQDDVWDRDKLITAIQKLDGIKAPALYCGNAQLVDSKLQTLNSTVYKKEMPISFKRVLIAGEIQGATMVMNRSLACYFSGKDVPKYLPMHDYYVAAVCGAIGGEYVFDFSSHMKYRQHQSNVLGVSVSIKDKVKRNVFRIIKKNSFSDLELFSKQLLNDFDREMSHENLKYVEMTADYRKKFISRIQLALDCNLKFGSINQELTYRISLLLGNI